MKRRRAVSIVLVAIVLTLALFTTAAADPPPRANDVGGSTVGLSAPMSVGGLAGQGSAEGCGALASPGSCPPQIVVDGSLSTSLPSMPYRLFRNGVASPCAPPKPYPGYWPYDGPHYFNVHGPYGNSDYGNCVTVSFNTGTCGVYAHAAAYLDGFNPADLGQGYVGDVGSSTTQPFHFWVPAGRQFYVVVQTTYGAASCNYSFGVVASCTEYGGHLFHDEAGDGVLMVDYQGVENGVVTVDSLSYTTNTSGYWGFDVEQLGPPPHQFSATPPAGSWWTHTNAAECTATTPGVGECNFGFRWGPELPTAASANGTTEVVTLPVVQDATVHQWFPAPQGDDPYLRIRQPGIGAGLMQFDLSTVPEGADVVSARVRMKGRMHSNWNRLYMTAYQVLEAWDEGTVTWATAPATGDAVAWGWLDWSQAIQQGYWTELKLDPAVVQLWLDDLSSNYGLYVAGEGSPNKQVEIMFSSSEFAPGVAVNPPELEIEYIAP